MAKCYECADQSYIKEVWIWLRLMISIQSKSAYLTRRPTKKAKCIYSHLPLHSITTIRDLNNIQAFNGYVDYNSFTIIFYENQGNALLSKIWSRTNIINIILPLESRPNRSIPNIDDHQQVGYDLLIIIIFNNLSRSNRFPWSPSWTSFAAAWSEAHA